MARHPQTSDRALSSGRAQTQALPTEAQDGEEEQPEHAEDGGHHDLADGGNVEALVQFGGDVHVVNVVPVNHVLEQHVEQPWWDKRSHLDGRQCGQPGHRERRVGPGNDAQGCPLYHAGSLHSHAAAGG